MGTSQTWKIVASLIALVVVGAGIRFGCGGSASPRTHDLSEDSFGAGCYRAIPFAGDPKIAECVQQAKKECKASDPTLAMTCAEGIGKALMDPR